LKTVANTAIEVYQKISELVNSLNQSIEEMNQSQTSSPPQSLQNIENQPPSSQSSINQGYEYSKAPLSSSSNSEFNEQNEQNEPEKKVYERRLPPNVEAMLREKRQLLASQLS
jgi:hypothetical protein